MKLKEKLKHRLRMNPYVGVFFIFDDARLNLRLVGSLLVNGIYIVTNGIFAAVYRDVLLLSVSVYYALLALIRYFVLRSNRSKTDPIRLRRTAFAVGILLLFLDVMMSTVMVFTLLFGVIKRYNPFTVIPQALFSAFCLIGVILRISRHSENRGIASSCIDSISLAAALFSVFNLVNYLSHTGLLPFGGGVPLAVGCSASACVLLTAVSMIVKNKGFADAE